MYLDRRGRGDSGDTPPWSVQREVQDLAAVVEATGEAPFLYGHSSGGALAIEAASAGVAIRRLAVYEPPYVPGAGTAPETADRMAALCAEGRPEEAARLFLHNTGMGEEQLQRLAAAPWWPRMVGLAGQLAYDVRLGNRGEIPAARLERIECDVLAMAGGRSPAWATEGAAAIAAAAPHATARIIEGHDHGIVPGVVAPLLADFFGT